jgi:glutamine---fructose-6-phosphate transaminase (isomerizing)
MCGIVGMVGDERPCVNVLLDGLKRLEYRGYDSAGIATVIDGEFEIVRSAGKLRKLESKLGEQTMAGTLGIGHTRWATHGRPSEENAHPHRHEDVVVVHNGIIENYAAIKKDLGSKGHSFSSETDSEIIAHLVHLAYANSGDLLVAVQATLKQLTGSFAIGVLHVAHPDRMVVARRMSPLVLGLGESENYVASDVPALLNETRQFIFLEDDELALLTKSEVNIYSLQDLTPLERPVRNITWTPAMAEKGGYKHFMLKEIYEQPRAVTDTLRPRLALAAGDVNLEELGELESRANEWDTIAIVACGTSYHAGLVGKYLIEELVRIPCTLEVASEFRYRNPLVNERQLLVAVSQSGETADTIAAVQEAQKRGASVLTICNVVDSTLARMSDAPIYTFAGPEIGVASTKAFTAQLAAFALLTIWLGRRRGAIDADAGRLLLEDLIHLPILMEEALKEDEHIQQVARKFIRTNSMLYLGRGLGFPIAMEGALKLKELSYIHAEGYPAGEMKHGPIALVDDETPSLFIVPEGASFEKTVSNMEEIKSRGGPIIAVTTKGQDRINDLAQDIFHIPPCNAFLESFLTVLPLQLFSYHVADLKGTDVDQPRNLAKSVTVE